jgi:hypothetical protein
MGCKYRFFSLYRQSTGIKILIFQSFLEVNFFIFVPISILLWIIF